MNSWCILKNASAVPLTDVPLLPIETLRSNVISAAHGGARLGAWFGDGAHITAVMVHDAKGEFQVARALAPENYPALTPDCPQAQYFERELAEQYGVIPDGHPWFKPVRYHHRLTPGPDAWGRNPDELIPPGVADMFRVEGDEVHEVAVGPVHAGVIEPGHFRFQCSGEHVFHLEIHLGYQHRGIERALVGGPHRQTFYHMETAAGDTTIGHGWAHCLVLEALAGVTAPTAAQHLRALMLELERLANHTGDMGALAGDVGFLPTLSFNGRIRGDFLNMSAVICGSRLGRGMLRPGGVTFGIEPERRDDLLRRLESAGKDVTGSVELLMKAPSVLARFEHVGVVRPEDAAAMGLVGVARRACGVKVDARRDHPLPAYQEKSLEPAIDTSGDVEARATVRALEIQESLRLVRQSLMQELSGPLNVPLAPLRPDHLAIGLVEGWRGPVLHIATTGADGTFTRYKIVDPSFHNWFGLMLALRDEQISDFPLCNKSFNLSYCGVDL